MARMVAYFPCLIAATLFFWPVIMKQVRLAQFPVIKVAGFSIRLTEILFYALFGMMVFLLFGRKAYSGKKLLFSNKMRKLHPYLIAVLALLTFGALQGYWDKNPILLLDLRGISYALFPFLIIGSIRSLNQLRRPFKIFYIALIIVSLSNLLSMGYRLFGLTIEIGKYSNLSVMLSLYLLCLSISFWIYLPDNKVFFGLISTLALISCLTSFQKQVWLGCIVIFIGQILFAPKNIRLTVLRVILLFGVPTFIFYIVLYNSNLYEIFFNKTFSEYYYDRILRESVYDISGGRLSIWSQIVIDAIKNPFLGSGLGVEGIHTRSISIAVHEHNILMWSLRRFSFLGTVIIVLLGIKFYGFSIAVYKYETDIFRKALVHSSLIYLLVDSAINSVIILYFTFEPAIIFWLNIAVVLLVYREQLPEKNNKIYRTV